MITYAQEIKKEHYPYTAKDTSTGTNRWENVQNVISNSNNYAQCSTGWNSESNLDITFSSLSDFNIKEAYLKVSCYASSSRPYLYMYDSTGGTTIHSCNFPTSKTLITSSKDVTSFINLKGDTTFRLTATGSTTSATVYIYSVYLELTVEEQGNNKTIYLGANDIQNIYLGANDIQNIYLGNNAVSSVYLGNSLIYGNTKDEIIESNGIIVEGLTLYLDGRDYVKNSYKWNSRAGSESVDFSYSGSVPSKVGNCVKMNSSSYGFCFANPFASKVSTFTLELYIKDISIIPNNNMHLMSITKNLEYGILVAAEGPDYRETGQTELGVSIHNGSTFNFYYPTKVTSNSSVYVQITCLNGKLDLYIDGNLVSTANNFSMQMPSQNTKEVALLLGNYTGSLFYSTSEPTFASVRYYVRSLTKDELENNRNFDLSIY